MACWLRRAAPTGKRVAVVGAGPAGLACAHRLAAKGLNINKAQPVGWNLAGAGALAAYQVTLNPLEIIETEE